MFFLDVFVEATYHRLILGYKMIFGLFHDKKFNISKDPENPIILSYPIILLSLKYYKYVAWEGSYASACHHCG